MPQRMCPICGGLDGDHFIGCLELEQPPQFYPVVENVEKKEEKDTTAHSVDTRDSSSEILGF